MHVIKRFTCGSELGDDNIENWEKEESVGGQQDQHRGYVDPVQGGVSFVHKRATINLKNSKLISVSST